jgi:hypothetical protein
MSFKNPFRDVLKEDNARMHWEDYVLPLGPEHTAARRVFANRRLMSCGIADATMEQIEEERRVYEEELFQEWLDLKQSTGFANFSQCDDPDEF